MKWQCAWWLLSKNLFHLKKIIKEIKKNIKKSYEWLSKTNIWNICRKKKFYNIVYKTSTKKNCKPYNYYKNPLFLRKKEGIKQWNVTIHSWDIFFHNSVGYIKIITQSSTL